MTWATSLQITYTFIAGTGHAVFSAYPVKRANMWFAFLSSSAFVFIILMLILLCLQCDLCFSCYRGGHHDHKRHHYHHHHHHYWKWCGQSGNKYNYCKLICFKFWLLLCWNIFNISTSIHKRVSILHLYITLQYVSVLCSWSCRYVHLLSF